MEKESNSLFFISEKFVITKKYALLILLTCDNVNAENFVITKKYALLILLTCDNVNAENFVITKKYAEDIWL